jgi:hypothetical protein
MPKISRLILAILALLCVALPSATPIAAQTVPVTIPACSGTADVSAITARLDLLEQQAVEQPAAGPVVTEAAQTVIPRYADGKSPPAGSLNGGVYKATHETQNQTIPAVVITEDCDQKLSAFTSLTPEAIAAVQQPILRDVTISGIEGEVNDRFEFNTGKPVKYGGAIVNATGAVVDNLHVFGIPGLGGKFTRSGYTNKVGPGQLWDRPEHLLSTLSAKSCFSGFDFAGTDLQIRGCVVSGWRGDPGEFGIKLSGHANQCSDFHAYGGRGPGIWIAGQGNLGTDLESENAEVGILIDGDGNTFSIVRCFVITDCCLRVNGHHNSCSQVALVATKTGLELNDQHNTVTGQVNGTGEATCVVLNNAVGQKIDLTLAMYGQPKARGLVATTGQVSYCDINLSVSGGAVGADFSAGLGIRNRIRVTTKDATVAPILLPKTRDASNEIIVNGVRQ